MKEDVGGWMMLAALVGFRIGFEFCWQGLRRGWIRKSPFENAEIENSEVGEGGVAPVHLNQARVPRAYQIRSREFNPAGR